MGVFVRDRHVVVDETSGCHLEFHQGLQHVQVQKMIELMQVKKLLERCARLERMGSVVQAGGANGTEHTRGFQQQCVTTETVIPDGV